MKRSYLTEKFVQSLKRGHSAPSAFAAVVLLVWAMFSMPFSIGAEVAANAVPADSGWAWALPIALMLVMFVLFITANPFAKSLLKRM